MNRETKASKIRRNREGGTLWIDEVLASIRRNLEGEEVEEMREESRDRETRTSKRRKDREGGNSWSE